METTDQKIDRLEQKIDKIYLSVERTRKYFMWTGIVTLILFILPLLVLVFVLPAFINGYLGDIQGLL